MVMKIAITLALASLVCSAAHAEYTAVDMTVFGMDCAPCAHAVHVSMKGIQGVNTVDVDLNTGLVAIKLAPGNAAGMQQMEQAIERNGFTHKDATVTARGKLTGTASAPVLEVTGTNDRYALSPAGQAAELAAMVGKNVEVQGVLPQAAKGKIPDKLRYKSIVEAQ
jgi:cation transport ATPase